MPVASSRDVKDEQTTREVARKSIQTYHAKPDERISLGPLALRKGRHLDLNEILARSLPKALGE